MNLLGWAFKLETVHNGWLYELLLFVVICPAIIYTGKRNASHAGPEGYSYGRAMGFVLAMMMFAGIVYGVGRFLIINFMGIEYYSTLNENVADTLAVFYRNSLLEKDAIMGMLRNPFHLIFEGVIGLVFRGGFLGLVLCAFVYKQPDIFASAASADPAQAADRTHDNENEN